LIAPITTVLIVLAVPFITAWFGPGFEEAGRIAQLLLASQLLLPLYQLGDQVLIGKNRFSVWVRGGMTLAVLNVALSLVLVQFWGPIGVAAATLIACLLEFPWYARVFGREMALDLGPWLRKTAWPVYPLLLIPAAVALLAVSAGVASTPIQVAAVAAASLLAYWAAALPLAYSADERTYLRELLRRGQRGASAS
jgi:O-antigen/teichoic acid export membrane protein